MNAIGHPTNEKGQFLRSLTLALTGLLCSGAFAADKINSASSQEAIESANEPRAFIEDLGLKKVQAGARQVYYGSHLEDELGEVRQVFTELSNSLNAQQQETERLLPQANAIIDEVNRWVGWQPDTAFVQEQHRILNVFLTNTLQTAMELDREVFLVPTTESKRYLREGGSLPGVSYDPETDQASFEFAVGVTPEGLRVSTGDVLVLPVDNLEELNEFLDIVKSLLASGPGLAFHELSEITLFGRLSPKDPYFRWFSDGFANAMSGMLTLQFSGEEAASRFAKLHDAEKYEDLRPNLLLRYWMGDSYCVKTSVESEKRLQQARYSFATLEAKRLIEKYGPEVLKKSIDLALEEKARTDAAINTSELMLRCFAEVTGEDLESRFLQYQPFQTVEEGIKYYRDAVANAVAKLRHEDALAAILRLVELRSTAIGQWPLDLYRDVALRLAWMGNLEESAQVFRDRRSDPRAANITGAAEQIQVNLVQMLFLTGGIDKRAGPLANTLLASDPSGVPGLCVQMELLSLEGQYEEAHKLAERIIESALPEESFFVSAAEFKVAALYLQGQGVAQDLNLARQWLHRAAEKGLVAAARNLGWFCINGTGGPQASAEGIQWLIKAAKQGDAEAHRALGFLYLEGRLVEKDTEKGLEHTLIAARAGDAHAQKNLGAIYLSGQGVPQDIDQAAEWLRKSAAQGNTEAQRALGQSYNSQENSPKNIPEAASRLKNARSQRDAHSLFTLGEISYLGAEIPKDVVEAYKWASLAEEAGHAGAEFLRNRIALEMSASQLAQAVRVFIRTKREWDEAKP